MVETVAAGALVVVGMLVVGTLQRPVTSASTATERMLRPIEPDGGPDLPCPWCKAPTDESDDHCPSCRQRFG